MPAVSPLVGRLVAVVFAMTLVAPVAAWAVGSTPVTVVNPENSAVPIRDAGQPQPVTGRCDAAPAAFGGVAFTGCQLFTVPAGKRLVVEMFSFYVTGVTGIGGNANPSNVSLNGFSFALGVGAVASTPDSSVPLLAYADTRMIRMYLNENESLNVSATYVGSPQGLSNLSIFVQSFLFSGFLVNK